MQTTKDRIFSPEEHTHPTNGPVQILYSSLDKLSSLSHIAPDPSLLPPTTPSTSTLPKSIVLTIHGAIKNPNTKEAQISYGVFFGKSSPRNLRGLVPEGVEKNDQAAEIYAAIMGLKAVREMVGFAGHGSLDDRSQLIEWSGESRANDGEEVIAVGQEVELVVLRVRHGFLGRVMEVEVWMWERKDWMSSKGKEVANGDLLKELQALLLS